MGSAVTITIGLAMVIVVFLSLGGEEPGLTREYGRLLISFGLFFALALVSGYAFIGTLRERPWLWRLQAATWAGVAAIGWYYWPK
jgi:hypothetical protein